MARLVAGPHSQPGRTKWRLPGSFQRHYRCRHQGGAVKPIPVVFHLGPLQIHTYGIGLALTFWFAYRYFAKRLRDHGYPDAWFSRAFIWIVIASVIGARAVHVVANLRGAQGYAQNPGDILAIWHGGLSSYGGLLGGVPTGLTAATLVSPAPPWRGSRPDRAGPGHRLDSGSAARSPAHVPGRWEPDARLVRHGLRRPGRKARAGADLPGSRRPSRLCRRAVGGTKDCSPGWPGRDRGHGCRHFVRCRSVQRRVRASTSSTGGDIAVLVASLAFVGGGAALAGWLLWRDRGVAHAAVTDPWRAPVAQCALDEDDDRASRIRRTRRASKSLKAVQRSQKPPTRPTRASEPVASRQLGRPTDRPWKLLDRQRGSTGRQSGSAIVTVG